MVKGYQRGKARQRKEKAIRIFFFCVALASITTLALIVIFLFTEGLPIFSKISIKDFIFGKYWYPTDDPADFGIFALIVASLAVTAVASAISIPLGVMTALYLAEVASARVREWVKPVVELLAALPSVVIGFFGMVVVAPFLQDVL
ncbi:MAG: phosphate ABC transporter permease subunit PstC, partial [Desulfobacteraceae bacterium]